MHVFTREGYPLARMRDVAAEMGLSEAAIHRYTGSKEDLFVSAIRHSLPLEDMPVGDLPLSPTPLAAAVWEAREFVAEAVPFGTLTEALSGHGPGDTAAELEKILLELFELESRTREAADMLERPARELPEMAGTLRRTPDTAVDALVHALFPASAVAAGGR